jgi:hypothetical protein
LLAVQRRRTQKSKNIFHIWRLNGRNLTPFLISNSFGSFLQYIVLGNYSISRYEQQQQQQETIMVILYLHNIWIGLLECREYGKGTEKLGPVGCYGSGRRNY